MSLQEHTPGHVPSTMFCWWLAVTLAALVFGGLLYLFFDALAPMLK